MKLRPFDKITDDRIHALTRAAPDTLQGVAAVLDLPESEATDFLTEHAEELDRKVLKLSLLGDLLEPKARRLAEKLIDRMAAEFDGLDLLEAVDFMKHVLRVIELSDRARQRETETKVLPVFNFVFQRPDPPGVRVVEPVVIEAQTREVAGGE